MKVAEVVVRILEDEGIEAAFGIPGAAINPVYKYLKDSHIRHYIARHEEGAVHAADGYCRASGRMAAAMCTSGPAATNFVTGLYTAPGGLHPPDRHHRAGRFQHPEHRIVPVRGYRRHRAAGLQSHLVRHQSGRCRARHARGFPHGPLGRPGPVLVDLPIDVQMAEVDYHPENDHPLPWSNPNPDPAAIAKAMDLIAASEAPILILGGGVILSDATEEFRALAEHLEIPFIMTYMGKAACPTTIR